MNARDLALKTLVQISTEQAFSNLEINKIIQENQLNKKDQNLLITLVYGTLQHLLTLDYVLKKFIKKGFNKLNTEIKWILRIAAFQILFLNNIPEYAIVNEAVNQTKKVNFRLKGFVNGVIRNIIRDKTNLLVNIENNKNPEIRYSIPKWIYQKYKECYGDKTNDILKQINNSPDLFIRVKPENFEIVFNQLNKIGAEPEIDPDLKNRAIIIKNPSVLKGGISKSELYKNGLITIQDKGAIQIGLALQPNENDLILDICSAPGGKTTLLAEELNGTGQVEAFDIHPHRVNLIKKNTERLKLKNVKASIMDATIFNPDYEGKFDKVLVDAPCSGLGIIRRKPEIRYSITQNDINELIRIQIQILSNAIKYLKPGGKLVYSTCTINTDENSGIINKIKNKFKNEINLIEEVQTSFLDNSDGFYFALLERKPNE